MPCLRAAAELPCQGEGEGEWNSAGIVAGTQRIARPGCCTSGGRLLAKMPWEGEGEGGVRTRTHGSPRLRRSTTFRHSIDALPGQGAFGREGTFASPGRIAPGGRECLR